MKVSTKVIAVAVVVVIGGTSTPLPAGARSGGLADAIRFRASFGLPSDYSAVEASYEDVGYDSMEWGVPLSDAELENLEARSTRRESFPAHA
jgi:hypothetical protein